MRRGTPCTRNFRLSPLSPQDADASVQAASAQLEQAQHSADPAVAAAAVQMWQRHHHRYPGRPIPSGPIASPTCASPCGCGSSAAGTPADLDEAVDAGRQAVAATPAGHPNRPEYLSNLGVALSARFPHSRNKADLDEAVDAGREAVAAPADHPNRGKYLSNLGIALQTRFGENAI